MGPFKAPWFLRHSPGPIDSFGNMPVLIQTHYGDLHGTAVAWAIGSIGESASVWNISDIPRDQFLTLSFDHDRDPKVRCHDQDLSDTLDSATTVWNRRIGRVTTDITLNDGDREYVEYESKRFRDGIRYFISQQHFWVNPVHAADAAEAKPLQLDVARSVGFNIPDTLITNDPSEVQQFRQRHGSVVFKTFRCPIWVSVDNIGKRTNTTFTTVIENSHEIGSEEVCLAPAIYQQLIEKRYDVRVVCMGHTLFAMKINPPDDPFGRPDWRPFQHRLDVSVISLPNAIRNKIFQIMESLCLCFGCFDFVVDRDGKFYFLEINQMGQFLWMERLYPRLPLLDAMAKFLISEDPQYIYNSNEDHVTYENFLTYAQDTKLYDSYDKVKLYEQLKSGYIESFRN